MDKLMWVFYKNECVKQKKVDFSCKIDRKFAQIDIVALSQVKNV